MDLVEEVGLEPSRVVVDHNNEETVREVLDRGYWAAFTIYPKTKMGNERMVEVVRQYGSERIIVDSSADWGVSDPLAVPKTARLMLERGISRADVDASCYGNAIAAYGQSGQIQESDWLDPGSIDQRELFEGQLRTSAAKPLAPRVKTAIAPAVRRFFLLTCRGTHRRQGLALLALSRFNPLFSVDLVSAVTSAPALRASRSLNRRALPAEVASLGFAQDSPSAHLTHCEVSQPRLSSF